MSSKISALDALAVITGAELVPIAVDGQNYSVTLALIRSHEISDITNLATILSSKAEQVHTHSASSISDFTAQVTAVVGGIPPTDVEVGALEW